MKNQKIKHCFDAAEDGPKARTNKLESILVLNNYSYFNICGKLSVIRCVTGLFSVAENRF